MSFDFDRARQHLQSFNIRKLFIQEMGWDLPGPDIDISYDGDILYLEAIAQKRGLSVYVCSPLEDGRIPGYAGRRKIEVELRKFVHEHILIFTNLDNSRQVWQWVRREPGRPTMRREFTYHLNQSGDPLLQRLQKLVMTLEEEENLGIVDVTSRVRAAFDVEPVTRRFYDRYSKEHAAFMQFLKGIPGEEDQRWYASVTLNRLMFVYFIQKKLFLNNDEDYLKSKLIESKHKGADLFYRDFLCPLFFKGFAVNYSDRKPEVNRLLGNVPYLNGGIFQKHQLENIYGNQIQIPDSAFERIFDFFDQYRWHLDERPLRNDREINPDVLGYIFEKYINQKEMGAYYTKEDITGYISRSTVLPYLLDQAKKDYAIAFTGEHSVWHLLSIDPNRYIFPSVQKGVDLDLPADIEAGINDVTQRTEWNKTASEEYALPTETWREVVARRTRFEELHKKLVSSNVNEVNDLITFNLDIEQFTQDLIESSESPELLRAFWKALKGITILDPTCGSGAFLFAALNILEPLYEACLERMRVFIAELDQSGEKHRPEKFSDFREVLTQVEEHHNERYFILKSIIVNNLFGVDIMYEAVEICKLRLFLKLIAQVERAEDVEPLPDIDFNIRSGNTLVGFTSIDEVKKALMGGGAKSRLPFPEEEAQLNRIKEQADLANRAYLQFQRQQLEKGMITLQDKEALRSKLKQLNHELNCALAKTYGIDPSTLDYSPWLQSHKPFNWLVDFFGIIMKGGFDVIVGNPPYVEYQKICQFYKISNFQTLQCNNLYAFVVERSISLLSEKGFCGFIIPISAFSNQSMKDLQKYLRNYNLYVSSFHQRPAQLFEGVLQRLSVFVLQKKKQKIFTTMVRRWYSCERRSLFETLSYTETYQNDGPQILKIGNALEKSIIAKIYLHKPIDRYLANRKNQEVNYISYRTAGGGYWLTFLNSKFKTDSLSNKIASFHEIYDSRVFMAVLNSNLFWWFYYINFDLFNLKDYMIFSFRFSYPEVEIVRSLSSLAIDLESDLLSNSIQYLIRSKTRGETQTYKYQNYKSKVIIDEIDTVLARHYGFTDQELDFVINYDIKYRMGASTEETE